MSPFRSLLFVPANHPRRMQKALALRADAVILDLEDACPIASKVEARALLAAALQQPRSTRCYVRVNALATPFAYGDFVAAVMAGADGIMLPKVERASDLAVAGWLMTQLERERQLPPGSLDLIPLLETALAFDDLRGIARDAGRVRRLTFGAADLTAELGMAWSRGEAELAALRSALVVASRAAGLEPPIDTVWGRLDDKMGFTAAAQAARAAGFQGKLCIHPDQIDTANCVFAPSADEVAWAREVMAAFAEAEANGAAAAVLNGQFLDYAVVRKAERITSHLQTSA